MATTSTMRGPSAAICRLLGWTVGDVLESHDPPGRIRLTAIGDGLVLAEDLTTAPPRESLWELYYRDWSKVEPANQPQPRPVESLEVERKETPCQPD